MDVQNVLNRFGYRGLYDRRAVDAFAKEAYAKAFETQEARYKDGAARLYDEDGTFTRDTVHDVLTRLFSQKGILLPHAGSGTPSLARRRIETKRRGRALTKDDVGELMRSLR